MAGIINIACGLVFNVTPPEGATFDSFQQRAKSSMESLASELKGVNKVFVETSDRRIYVAFDVNPKAVDYRSVVQRVREMLVVLSEHGEDADLLGQLLERHPELKAHPRFNRVVGAFQNLRQVIADVCKDNSVAVQLELQRRTVEHDPPDVEQFKGRELTEGVKNRVEFRDQSLRGQITGQGQRDKPVTPPPVLPPSYVKDAADGNIFQDRRPAKTQTVQVIQPIVKKPTEVVVNVQNTEQGPAVGGSPG